LPIGTNNGLASRNWIWWRMMAAWEWESMRKTLDMTDVCTGWTETIAVPNKAQVWVFAAINKARGRLPFSPSWHRL